VLGMLYDGRGNAPQALKQFAEDVCGSMQSLAGVTDDWWQAFHSSLAYGPFDANTACGYWHQAQVFDKCGYPDTANVRAHTRPPN
jgi:hypothetical protein